MTITRIIRAADCPEVPWKNGGCTTREIAVFPSGAGMGDFLWRLSMARVEQAGPFSAFDGVDRTLAVIAGSLALTGPGIAVRLDPGSPPFPFGGGVAVHGEPLGEPVLDLNAMVRSGHCACTMTRLAAGDLATSTGTGFFVALEAQTVSGSALGRLDCIRFAGSVTAAGAGLFVDFVPD
ncbi:HutD family protein [Novosphingobium resinovorum]|uniref:HutD/Ves family protein n=1 Tax=Novosphingobium resinovorum TaxID=158500 RepID=UPI002ED48F92|nr:HutD family protein [Novosphingobium resinovorum]